ncbi:MAG TPA: hypothetical protein VFW38_13845 [Solirubrobacteraceae bacterium]|nr:hypothetical protein [Solirubrobacteraceae bacterium]
MLGTARLVTMALFALVAAVPTSAQATTVCPPPAETAEVTAASEPGEVVIACVGSRPLTEATFKHWDEVAATGDDKAHPPSAHDLLVQVMGFLISSVWVQGEARALHVHVSPAAVHRQFELERHLQFPRRRDFQRFLKKSKQTVADLLMRVELDMLSQRIQRRVAAGHRGAKARQEALARFVARFRERWTSQTYCASRYAMRDCGHVQSSL